MVEIENPLSNELSLKYYGKNDFATVYDIKYTIEHYKDLIEFLANCNCNDIETRNDFFCVLLVEKYLAMEEMIPAVTVEYRNEFSEFIDQVKKKHATLNIGNLIKYINKHISEIFNQPLLSFDIRLVSIEYIAMYKSGIDNSVFLLLCKEYPYLMIDKFDAFEDIFINDLDLFRTLFNDKNVAEFIQTRLSSMLGIFKQNKVRKNQGIIAIITLCENQIDLLINEMINNLNDSNAMSIEPILNDYYKYLKDIQSPKANALIGKIKIAEAMIEKYIIENGKKIEFEIPADKIINEWRKKNSWQLQLLTLTHAISVRKGKYIAKSHFDNHDSIKSKLIDHINTTYATDEYFTASHQESLKCTAMTGTALLLAMFGKKEDLEYLIKIWHSAIVVIADQIEGSGNNLIRNSLLLANSLYNAIQANNSNANKEDIQSLCYGTEMCICGLIEELSRITYIETVKADKYIYLKNCTLGFLLNESNAEMASIFGEDHLRISHIS